jgi:hypothetical protein
MDWSKGLQLLRAAELATETSDLTDEEITDMDCEGQDVAVLPLQSWARIEPRAMELKHATEDGGRQACWDWLDATGVEWYRPPGFSDRFRPTIWADRHRDRPVSVPREHRE